MYDVALVGGGLVGLATARALLEARPDLRLVVLEKEEAVAQHQSSRNSGVLHAGVYYRPGSIKARFCREGKAEMERFCEEEEVPWRRCGKLIVAVDTAEIPRLDELERRSAANGVTAHRLGPEAMRDVEPHAAGVAALHVPETGVADFGAAAAAMARRLTATGAEIRTGARLTAARPTPTGWALETTAGTVEARFVITCAGLWADRVARLFGARPDVRLVPFRGEYVLFRPEAERLCRALIYPVPDPEFPFLGVHVTRTVHDHVDAGPSAALAFAREGYTLGTLRPAELAESLGYGGFRRLALKHWRMGIGELAQSLSRRRFLKAVQRLVPEVTLADLRPAPAGVRAQAVRADGSLADDFVIEADARAVHVINAPSPAATASLAIGRHVAGLALERLGQRTTTTRATADAPADSNLTA